MASKKKIFKKKGNIIKDLTKNIFKILKEDASKQFNYKQIAAKLHVTDTEGKNQIIQKLTENVRHSVTFNFRASFSRTVDSTTPAASKSWQ